MPTTPYILTALAFCVQASLTQITDAPSTLERSLFALPLPSSATVSNEVIADTTPPYRYFPLATGNVWEYQFSNRNERVRYEVVNTITMGGELYSNFEQYSGSSGQLLTQSFLRYDTTGKEIVQRNSRDEVYYSFPTAFCPFDSGFNTDVYCPVSNDYWSVYGGYEQAQVEWRDADGRMDTTMAANKSYFYYGDRGYHYVEGVGLTSWHVYHISANLTYARIDGREIGEQKVFVSRAFPSQIAPVAMNVQPNPTRGKGVIKLEEAISSPVLEA